MTTTPFRKLLQANLLAIISLLIALASLSYNTWRNDATEQNRNQRAAGYSDDHQKGDAIAGWTRVVFIGDLAHLTSPKVADGARDLRTRWSTEVGRLDSGEEANKTMSRSIESLRQETLQTLAGLR